MNAPEALAFVREHGVVLLSARGPVPRLVEAIAGEPVRGSWWGHHRGRHIYSVLQQLSDSGEILVCRLVNGKITFVHRRLWPALVRAAAWLRPEQLAQVKEEHTSSGRHVSRQIPFPQWVPPEVLKEARHLSDAQARRALGPAAPG